MCRRGAFAQVAFSAGGGLLFDGGRLGGFSDSGWDAVDGRWSEEMNVNTFGFGGFVFLDAEFAELSIAFMGGPARLNEEWEDGGDSGSWTEEGSFLALDFTLLGRLPFALGGLTAFPLFGVGYSVVLSASADDYDFDDPGDFSTFRILLGFGGDLDIADNMFLRGSVLGYYRFAPTFFRDWERLGGDAHGGFGVKIRAAIGFRF